MIGSTMVHKKIPADRTNYTKNRSQYGKVSEITIHHAAGIMSVDALGVLWQRKGRKASSHYGVSGNQVGQYVSEGDVAWTNSNWDANVRAVTIEVSNSKGAPNWEVSEESLQTTIELVADIAKRNGLHPLVYGKSLTWHSLYSATACPGPYLKNKLKEICEKANERNQKVQEERQPQNQTTILIGPASAGDLAALSALAQNLQVTYQVMGQSIRVEQLSYGDFVTFEKKAQELNLPLETEQVHYVVQVGYFSNQEKAQQYANELKQKGVEAFIKAV